MVLALAQGQRLSRHRWCPVKTLPLATKGGDLLTATITTNKRCILVKLVSKAGLFMQRCKSVAQ